MQLLSKRLLRISRDNLFWRLRCHEESSFLEGVQRRRSLRFSDDDEPLVNAALGAQTADADVGAQTTRKAAENERIRILANWDPTFQDERVNWYNEYLQRHGSVAVNWFQQPQIRDGDIKGAIEVKGAALYRPLPGTDALFAVAPLDDGSVTIWDVKGTRQKKGSIISKSKEGLLNLDNLRLSSRSKMPSIGITECVSVDSSRDRAFFAVQSRKYIFYK